MAHFLSDVTHCRLELRGEDPTSQEIPIAGITHTHDYSGQIRCFDVIPTCRAGGDTASLITWSGELDGQLVAREGVDGKPTRVISDQVGKAFIFALLYADPYVWAGYSDGYIRFFNAERQQLAEEVPIRKAHSAAITSLLLHKQHVFSCSVDWMIVQWDARTLSPVPHSQLSGHSNAVRCMIAEGNRLYSGGDDFTIRCWDLDTATEKGAPWPITMHRDSVRSLALHQVFLFSASNDGTLCAWNTQSAQLVRQLDARECPINSLFLDLSSLRLWSAAQDGIVSIWDVKTMSLVGTRREHHNTNVAIVSGVARVNSVKSWTLGRDGAVYVWYSDSDAGTNEFEQLQAMESSLQEHVEQYRQRIVDNYKALEQCKGELVELERRDRRKKVLLSEAFAGQHKRIYLRNAIANVTRWKDQKNFKSPRVAIATSAAQSCNLGILWGYFIRWGTFSKQQREMSLKRRVQQHLARTERSILVKAYVQKMATAARVYQRRRWLNAVSSSLMRQLNILVVAPVFGKWLRFQADRNEKRKHVDYAVAQAGAGRLAAMTSYWYKLKCANRSARLSDRVKKTLLSLSKACAHGLARRAFSKLLEYRRQQFQNRLRAKACQFLLAQTTRRRLTEAFQMWSLLSHNRARDDAQRELCAQHNKIDTITSVLKENESTTEEQLEAQLRERQVLLARILAENDELGDDVSTLEQRKRLLQREAMRDVSIDSTAPPQQQLSEAIMYLKARGVNTFHDIQHIQQAREEAKSKGAETVLRGGIETIRKVFGRVLRPAKLRDPGSIDWYVGELFTKIKKKSVERASVGLCKMVTAFDMINPSSMNSWVAVGPDGGKCWDTAHSYNKEVMSNLGPLLELAIRSYRYRRNEDPETGESTASKIAVPKKKKVIAKRSLLGPQNARKSSRPATKKAELVDGAVIKKTRKRKVKKSLKPAASATADSTAKKSKRKVVKKKAKASVVSQEMIATPMEQLVAPTTIFNTDTTDAAASTKEEQDKVLTAGSDDLNGAGSTLESSRDADSRREETPARGRTLERPELEEF